MSRLFEALQKSVSEGAGIGFPESLSSATNPAPAAEGENDVLGQPPSLSVTVTPDKRLVTLTSKESLGAEKFRLLAVRLKYLQQIHAIKRLLITSTIAEEGKSLVAANLAVSLARRNQQKVLLVEGDLRRPALANVFGLEKLPGLSEWLGGAVSSIANIYRLEEPGFSLLPAGNPPENPLELMQSGKLAELLDQLSTCFDWIVIDSPPVLPLADTSVLMRLADGVLLVAREGKTEKRQFKRGLEALGNSNLLGVVFNDCTTADHSNYYQRYHANAGQLKRSDSKQQVSA